MSESPEIPAGTQVLVIDKTTMAAAIRLFREKSADVDKFVSMMSQLPRTEVEDAGRKAVMHVSLCSVLGLSRGEFISTIMDPTFRRVVEQLLEHHNGICTCVEDLL